MKKMLHGSSNAKSERKFGILEFTSCKLNTSQLLTLHHLVWTEFIGTLQNTDPRNFLLFCFLFKQFNPHRDLTHLTLRKTKLKEVIYTWRQSLRQCQTQDVLQQITSLSGLQNFSIVWKTQWQIVPNKLVLIPFKQSEFSITKWTR